MTSHVTTHVLDAVSGSPAQGIDVALWRVTDDSAERLASATTDTDGRVRDLGAAQLEPGTYRVTFATGAYFAATGQTGFFPEVSIAFTIVDGDEHHHVPLLLSPYAYSTYRGS